MASVAAYEGGNLAGFTDTLYQMEGKLRPGITYEEVVAAYGPPTAIPTAINDWSVAYWHAWDGRLVVKFSTNRVKKWSSFPVNSHDHK
jgi:hypothetical protein